MKNPPPACLGCLVRDEVTSVLVIPREGLPVGLAVLRVLGRALADAGANVPEAALTDLFRLYALGYHNGWANRPLEERVLDLESLAEAPTAFHDAWKNFARDHGAVLRALTLNVAGGMPPEEAQRFPGLRFVSAR